MHSVLLWDMNSWGYRLDAHLDEMENIVHSGNKTRNRTIRILDVASRTGTVGQKATYM